MARMLLPVNGFLTRQEHESDSCKGDLRCSCGSELFRIRHNGRQAKPFLGLWSVTNWIRPGSTALVIDARCSHCGKVFLLHCSERNEHGWLLPGGEQMTEFEHPRLRDQSVRVSVWYCWDDTPEMENGCFTTSYTLFSLAVRSDEHQKEITIFEQA